MPSSLVEAPLDSLTAYFDSEIWDRREEALEAIDNNLRYLSSPQAEAAYRNLEGSGITRLAVERTLRRFRVLLLTASSPEELRGCLAREFALYRSKGRDGMGTVRFTGYFQPVYQASRWPTAEYKYPIYRLPPDFEVWSHPHPTRVTLEGFDGTGSPASPAWGYELAWLRTRYEAFMIHVQGSAILELTDGSRMAVGFAGATNYRFGGISKTCLAQAGLEGVSWKKLYFNYTREFHRCLSRNNRFIFFKVNPRPDPIGNLGVPVVAERSIATDKLKLPPGALGFIRTRMPYQRQDGAMALKAGGRFVLDQDAGSAIKGPGRVDIFMGTGREAERKANWVYSDGELYYLVLKDGLPPPSGRPS